MSRVFDFFKFKTNSTVEVGNGNIITDRCTGSLVYFFCQKYCLRFLCTRLKSSSKILSSKGTSISL